MKKIVFTLALLLGLYPVLLAQEQVLKGKVTDGDMPLPGVNVLIKATGKGTITEMDGSFSLKYTGEGQTLEFRYIGYKTLEVPIDGRAWYAINLQEDVKQLSAVVVDGYSTQDIKKMTSSVEVIDAEMMEQRPVATFDQALQGQAAGVQISMDNKSPGSAASVKIRGTRSLAGASQALFLVDGVPVDGRTFATLNPNDFASVQVLKDASAVAIYGSRGANGVVVITTKDGKKSAKPQIKLNSYTGFSQATTSGFRMMNSQQRVEFEKRIQDGPTYNPESYGYMGQEPDVNQTSGWYDAFYRTGISQSHQLSVSGGDEDTKYYLSGNYFDQQGVVMASGMQRGTMRANFSQQLNRFKMDLKTQLSVGEIDRIYRNDAYNVLTMLPYYHMKDAEGNYLPLDYIGSNAFERIEKGENSSRLLGIISSLKLDYEITDGLKVWSRTSLNYDQENTRDIISPNSLYGQNTGRVKGGRGMLSATSYQDYSILGTNALQYNRNFGDHGVSVGLFQEYALYDGVTDGYTLYGFDDEVTPALYDPSITPDIFGTYDKRQTQLSYFTVLDYDYKGKYIFRGTYRRDGSSKFGANNAWGNFYSVGAGWVLSDEAFLNSSEWISNLKIRGSYGTVGNQGGISRYQSLATYASNTYRGRPAIYRDSPAYPDLQWEVSQQLNAGVDFGLWDNKLSGSFNYYNILTSNLFIDKPLPLTSGFDRLTQNQGKVNNQGVELSINANVIQSDRFSWDVFANVTHNRSKALELNDEGIVYAGYGQLDAEEIVLKEGEPLYMAYGFNKIGVDPATGRLLFQNPNGSIVDDQSKAQRMEIGLTEAPWFGGFGTSFSWKGLSVAAQFNWEQGAYKLNWDRVEIETVEYADQNHSVKLLDAWQNPGDVSPYQEAYSGQQAFATTDHWEDASFLRFKNLMVAYELPANALKRYGMNRVRIYAQAQNLMTFTRFTGIDPEMSSPYQSTNNGTSSANSSNAYPMSRTLTFGVDLTL